MTERSSTINVSDYTQFFSQRCGPTQAMTSSFMRFLDNTQRRIIAGRTPLDE